MNNHLSFGSADYDLTANLSMQMQSDLVCAEGYYLGNDSLCRPLCILWVDPPGVGLDVDNIATMISVVIDVLCAIILFVLSITTQRKSM